jgi:hypothetical protein
MDPGLAAVPIQLDCRGKSTAQGQCEAQKEEPKICDSCAAVEGGSDDMQATDVCNENRPGPSVG